MRVYFDTNVISHVAESRDLAALRRKLASIGWQVMASVDNLLEIYGISDSIARQRELDALVTIAARFDNIPQSFREATEVRQALARHRSAWVRRLVFDRSIKKFLDGHQSRWEEARAGTLPDPEGFATYRRDVEAGVAGSRGLLKDLRTAKLKERQAHIAKVFPGGIATVSIALDRIEEFWRIESWLAYDGALVQKNRATRDLADWILPYFKPGVLDSGSLFTFWMRDVDAGEIPRCVWAGRVAFSQLGRRISHGNPADQQHAAFMLDVDLFVTADKAFYEALVEASLGFPRQVARVALWDRRALTPEEALSKLADCGRSAV